MNHTLESFLSNLLIDQARRISPLNSKTLEQFRDRLENKKLPNCRKRKLTPITPFGIGYVSWGTPEPDKIEVVVSQRKMPKNQLMKVSVITSGTTF